jgi:hypothetical protein
MSESPKIPAGIAMLLKGLGLDAAELFNSVDGFRQIMAGIQSELIAIRRKQDVIMIHLGLDEQLKGIDDQLSDARAGETGGRVKSVN